MRRRLEEEEAFLDVVRGQQKKIPGREIADGVGVIGWKRWFDEAFRHAADSSGGIHLHPRFRDETLDECLI